jgi:type II secretory pathway component PulF
MDAFLQMLLDVLITFFFTVVLIVGMARRPMLSFFSGVGLGVLGLSYPGRVMGYDLRPQALGFLFLLSLAALLTRPRLGKGDPIRTGAVWLVHLLGIYVAYVLFFAETREEGILHVAFYVCFGVYLPIHLLRIFSSATRTEMHLRICSDLRQAVAMQLPLVTALAASAENAGGLERRILQRLGHQIEMGKSLGEALLVRYRQCPSYARGPILAAERMHRLSDGLDEAFRQLRSKARGGAERPSLIGILYLTALTSWTVTALSIFLMPMLGQVLSDAGLDVPPRFDWARQVLAAIAVSGNEIIAAFLGALGFALLLEKFWPGIVHRAWPMSVFWDAAAWWLWPFRAVHRTRQEQILVNHLRSGLRAGHRLCEMLEAASFLELNRFLALRVRRWKAAVSGGQDVYVAARKNRIPRSAARLFGADRNPQRMAYVAKAHLELIQARLEHRRRITYAAMLPVLIVLVGIPILALGVWLVGVFSLMWHMWV